MKKAIFLFFSLFFVLMAYPQKKNKHQENLEKIHLVIDSLSQYYTITDDGLLFSRVIQAPEYNKDALYVKILEIFSSIYNNAKVVIQAQDKEEGVIIGKGDDENITYDNISGGRHITTVHHTIKVEVREGRFKVSITLTDANLAYYDMRGVKSFDYHHQIFKFYPFSGEAIKLKHRDDSFNTIKFSIINANSLLDRFEDKIIKKDESEDW